MQFGRTKFVVKKRNGNGNGNGNMEGAIVSFIPFQNFAGDITKVSTSNYRQIQFNGIIAFEELNGCLGNAYLVENGVVKTKLTIQSPNQITPRCGEVYSFNRNDYNMITITGHPEAGCSFSYSGSTTYTSYGVPCLDAVSVGSSGNYGSSSASGTDATYSNFLSGNTIDAAHKLCASTFAFQKAVDPTAQNTRLEAGMKEDGIEFTVPEGYTGETKFGFNHVLFGLPEFTPNFQQGVSENDAAGIVSRAVNFAITQIQQDIQINRALTTGPSVLADNFWWRVNKNISNSLGITPITSSGVLNNYITLKSGGTVYYNPNTQKTQTIVFNKPVTGCP